MGFFFQGQWTLDLEHVGDPKRSSSRPFTMSGARLEVYGTESKMMINNIGMVPKAAPREISALPSGRATTGDIFHDQADKMSTTTEPAAMEEGIDFFFSLDFNIIIGYTLETTTMSSIFEKSDKRKPGTLEFYLFGFRITISVSFRVSSISQIHEICAYKLHFTGRIDKSGICEN